MLPGAATQRWKASLGRAHHTDVKSSHEDLGKILDVSSNKMLGDIHLAAAAWSWNLRSHSSGRGV